MFSGAGKFFTGALFCLLPIDGDDACHHCRKKRQSPDRSAPYTSSSRCSQGRWADWCSTPLPESHMGSWAVLARGCNCPAVLTLKAKRRLFSFSTSLGLFFVAPLCFFSVIVIPCSFPGFLRMIVAAHVSPGIPNAFRFAIVDRRRVVFGIYRRLTVDYARAVILPWLAVVVARRSIGRHNVAHAAG